MLDARDSVLATVRDIEDLVLEGKERQVCPYYATRKAVKQAQLVTLPYNLLLQKNAREALGIDLEGQIVVIDEAHSESRFLTTVAYSRPHRHHPRDILLLATRHAPAKRLHAVDAVSRPLQEQNEAAACVVDQTNVVGPARLGARVRDIWARG